MNDNSASSFDMEQYDQDDVRDLFAMHGVARPAYSTQQQMWIDKWILTLPGAAEDAAGNVIVHVGASQTIFSCHTDTVHKEGGKLHLRLEKGMMVAYRNGKRDVLGSDDAAGCWIMRRMIQAGVPGVYIFHQAEEWGGRGAAAIVEKNKATLSSYKHCIAFDRAGYDDVITYQSGHRTASNEFAKALAGQLNQHGFAYAPCHGVFTDSEIYSDLVPECSNISVGYFGQHGPSERLDIDHIVRLMKACLKIDWASLPSVRDPKAFDAGRWSWKDDWYDEYEEWSPSSATSTGGAKKWSSYKPRYGDYVSADVNPAPSDAKITELGTDFMDEFQQFSYWDSLKDMVERDPQAATACLVLLLGNWPKG